MLKVKYCGVYVIEVGKLNKVYVGSSLNADNRIYQHRSVLKCQKCQNEEMQDDWNLHYDHFVFSYSNSDSDNIFHRLRDIFIY